MKILVSNDDGVHAPGLAILAKALSSLAEITVFAPDRDKSAASHSLTLESPLRVQQQPTGFYAVNGTPSDSVHIALRGWMSAPPDMIVAGINHGANLGDDVLYSGTVAAAIEGRFLGYPAMAISLAILNNELPHFETAAKVAVFIINAMLKNPLPAETILNVNVPNKPLVEIKGIKIARLGYRHMGEQMMASEDPRGKPIYWIGPAGSEQDSGPGTDFDALNQGYVSITPIKTDLTDYHALENLKNWSSNLESIS